MRHLAPFLGILALSGSTGFADVSIEGVMKITTRFGPAAVPSVLGELPFTVLVRTNGDFRIDGVTPLSPLATSVPYTLSAESNLVQFLYDSTLSIPVGNGTAPPLPRGAALTVLPGPFPLIGSNARDGWPCLWLAYGFGANGWKTITNNSELPHLLVSLRKPISVGWRWRFPSPRDGMTCPESVVFVRDSSLDKPIAQELLNPWLDRPATTAEYNLFVSNRNDRLTIPDGFKGVELKVGEYREVAGLKVPSQFRAWYFGRRNTNVAVYEYEVTCDRIEEVAPQERLRPGLPKDVLVLDYRGLDRGMFGKSDRIHYRLADARDLPDPENDWLRKWFGYAPSQQAGRSAWAWAVVRIAAPVLGVGLVAVGVVRGIRRWKLRGAMRRA